MEETQTEEYREAKKKVKKLRHLFQHLAFFLVLTAFLHILNLMTSDYYWAKWPALGLGLSVVLHALKNAKYFSAFGDEWEKKKIQEILDKKAMN